MNANWKEDAACLQLDPDDYNIKPDEHGIKHIIDLFVVDDKRLNRGRYTNPKTRAKLANALAVCHSCPVIAECAAYMQTWDTPPRDIVIAGLAPRDAWRAWHTAHGHPHRRTA